MNNEEFNKVLEGIIIALKVVQEHIQAEKYMDASYNIGYLQASIRSDMMSMNSQYDINGNNDEKVNGFSYDPLNDMYH